jgi:hypothetical protein
LQTFILSVRHIHLQQGEWPEQSSSGRGAAAADTLHDIGYQTQSLRKYPHYEAGLGVFDSLEDDASGFDIHRGLGCALDAVDLFSNMVMPKGKYPCHLT